MLSNRVAAKKAYHRRVQKMERLQQENKLLTSVLEQRQLLHRNLAALVRPAATAAPVGGIAFTCTRALHGDSSRWH
jgi:hypothetical protein